MRSRCKVLSIQYIYYFRAYNNNNNNNNNLICIAPACRMTSEAQDKGLRTLQKRTLRQRTLHGVRVIIKLYFAIFATFKKSLTLNIAHMSFKVIDFGGNESPCTTLFRSLIVASLCLQPFQRYCRLYMPEPTV